MIFVFITFVSSTFFFLFAAITAIESDPKEWIIPAAISGFFAFVAVASFYGMLQAEALVSAAAMIPILPALKPIQEPILNEVGGSVIVSMPSGYTVTFADYGSADEYRIGYMRRERIRRHGPTVLDS